MLETFYVEYKEILFLSEDFHFKIWPQVFQIISFFSGTENTLLGHF